MLHFLATTSHFICCKSSSYNTPLSRLTLPTATPSWLQHTTLSCNTSWLQLLHPNSLECHYSLALAGKKHHPHFLSCATHWQLKLSSSSGQAISMAAPQASMLVCRALFIPRAPLPLSSNSTLHFSFCNNRSTPAHL